MSQLTEKFVIGRLGKAKGLRGEIKVIPLTDDPKRFNQLKACFLENEKGDLLFEKNIASCHIVNQEVSLRFADITDRNQAEDLRGLYISVKREDAISLKENSFFIADLIGCSVYDQEKGLLGKISHIQSAYSSDIIIVHMDGKKDLLYPNLKSIVQNIDLENQRVDIILPDGLYEIYR